LFFYLAFTDKGKFLLAARRYRQGVHTEYIISLDADDLSQGSNAYVGKLRWGIFVSTEVLIGCFQNNAFNGYAYCLPINLCLGV